MIGFVRQRMVSTLGEEHLDFIAAFEELSSDARCLYVRFANRKGRVFHRHHLRYEEIVSLSAALTELSEQGFIRSPREHDWRELLAIHTRSDLASLLRHHGDEPVPSSLKKRDVVSRIERDLSFATCFPRSSLDRFVVQDRIDEVDYLFFLYHGKLRSGLTALALRDLGLISRNRFQTDYQSRFASHEAARAAFALQKISAVLDSPTPSVVHQLASEVHDWPLLDDPESEALYHRSVYRLGRELERLKDPEAALRTYARSDQFPATERLVRLLIQTQSHDEAKLALERMIEDPSCDAELIFAEDFYERKFQQRKVGKLTTLLREARVFPIDETNRDQPEAGVISFLKQEGEAAVHTENLVWNQLFGLLFWDELFESESAPIHNEFERKPWGLDTGVFYANHRAQIEKRLQLLDRPDEAVAYLQTVWADHEGTGNSLVPWFPGTRDVVSRLVETAPSGALAEILRLMVSNHRDHRTGYPDLMVLNGDQLRFIEVKTEGDKISRKQLTRLEQLRRAGFSVEVGAVKWNVDPNQEYVVVDLETTGGKAQWNRVTEIGAVRVQGGKILETWSTLVNPERRIPKAIVHLTGITDEMVSTAPRFAEIADDFRLFVGSAVFVAHRVTFDYGFLRAEFRRLEQDFRCATLCTVVTARRVFPGLPSYSLANLSQTFGIPLDSHHRALCDALATAQILLRINQERLKAAE